jgi:multidrug efflux pump subunit AcrA (membrane-fusion protein)
MTVETGTLKRGDVAAYLTVVGNLIGLQTVDIAPRTAGRLLSVNVQLGDRVRRGQVLAKVEDREIVEQVRQAEASQKVSEATIRQREADLKVAEVNFDRSKNLFQRQLLAKQALDDGRIALHGGGRANWTCQRRNSVRTMRASRSSASTAKHLGGVSRSTDSSASERRSRRDGQPNTAIASVVEISRLRWSSTSSRRIFAGHRRRSAVVEVEPTPARNSPARLPASRQVLDPATRTATMEVEIPNGDYKLKPGMYARST